MKSIGMILVAFGFLRGTSGFSQDAQGDKEKIQGTWKIVSLHAHLPKAELTKEALKSAKVVITGDKLAFHFGKKIHEAHFKINPTKKPKTVDLADANEKNGKTAPGIYKLDGDDLTLCWNATNSDRPTEFTKVRKTGLDMRLLVLKREKKK